MVDIFGRPESTNVEDRRNALPPLLRSFEFDGKTIGLDMTGPNPHNGGMLTDQQAIGKYLSDHSYYGLPTNQQAHFSAANLDPRVIDTIIAEAGNDRAGQRAVAAAIINRANSQGKTPLQIVQQRGQFEGYSNPGKASTKAQQVASVRANAARSFNDIASGSVADPLNGGTDFRASSATGGLHAPHGTVTIGGNTFALGKAPSTGLEAIQAVAPVPMPSLPAQTSAYANLPATTPPPLPIPRPSNPAGIRSVEINPDGTPKGSLADILAGRYGNSTARTVQGDTSIYNAVPGFAPSAEPIVSRAPSTASIPLPRPRPDIPAPGLISRPVHTVAIDPLTGNPITQLQQLQQATEALAAKAAKAAKPASTQPPAFVSESHSLSNGVPAAPKNISYNSMAGTVALPPGVVPKSVQQDLPIVRSAQASNTPWFPFSAPPPQVASAPVPMPGRPASLNAPPPYIPGPNGYTVADKDASSLQPSTPLAFGSSVQPAPAVQAITQATAPKTQTVLNPAYTAALKAGQAYTAGGNIVTQAQQNAFGGLSVPTAPPKTLPPKYITVPAPHVPVPSPTSRPLTSFNTVNPASQIIPRAGAYYNTTPAGHLTQLFTGQPIQGGLLGMLFGNSTPMAGLFGGGPAAAPASPPPGANFLADRGVNTQGLTIGQQANELNKQLAGSSRNADGSRGFM